MTVLFDKVRSEIVEIHNFFTEWFNGNVDRDQLEARLLSHLHPDFLIISPAGDVQSAAEIRAGFLHGYGTNPDFRIQIRDVEIRHEMGSLILATYTEWQTGSSESADSNSARFSSVLLENAETMIWRHLHETALPRCEYDSASFDF